MSQSSPFDLTDDAQSSLDHLLVLLHLFAHRNKNQHRHSIWWRHFSILRRQLAHFLADLARFRAVPTTHVGRARQKALNSGLLSRNAQRREFWREVLVPRARDAFSQLVADQRFAVLGLVLLAVLADMCRILGLTLEMEEAGQAEVERVLEEFGREEWGQRTLEGLVERAQDGKEDFGEVVTRGDESRDPGTEVRLGERRREGGEESPLSGEGKAKTIERRSEVAERAGRRKKKRKKGDAIDDLFSGLG